MAETSHVPMAGVHAPTGDAARHVFTAATRSVLVVYTGRGDGGGGGDSGDGDGGGSASNAVHTEPPSLPTNAVVSCAVFESHTAVQSTWLNSEE